MATQGLQLKFIPLHIEPFEKEGLWFARCREFDVVSHGNSEVQATKNAFNMVFRSVFAAMVLGNLDKILKRAGVAIEIGVPDNQATADDENLWFLPLTSDAHVSAAP